ncbi:MAG: CHAT domain-containing protein [Symploca sp. SIO1C2]|nr:CHAT domain-containing protein [Symploca sp. SIO1C2]NER46165.1 CHAT domain-containing protein [Symploca sp. SIO1A3]
MPSSELYLQLYYIDRQILVICTGSSGEAYSLIEEPKVEELIRKSIFIHKQIDKFFPKSKVAPNQSKTVNHGSNKEKKSNQRDNTRKTRLKLVENLQELGELLFKYIFHDHILDLFNVVVGQAISSKSDVVVRLMIASDFLNLIPWELLYNDDTYLCHVYDLVRHPFIQQPVRRPISSEDKIRVLFVGANPLNEPYVKEQIEAVATAIKPENKKLRKFIKDATLSKIANGIYDGVDILHFLADGKCEYRSNNLKYHFLVLSEEQNQKYDKMPVEMLESFCRVNPMQLIILSACRSDQAILYRYSSSLKKHIDKLDKIQYKSIAHALIKTGVPCVIGMSHPISKMGAEIFTKRIYRTVIERQESIYKAVRQVRLELFAHRDLLPPSDWFTPVLYSRESQAS